MQRIFGYTQFRPGQEALIDGVLSGRDVFGIMPTGGGKSMCYQIPALLLPGITVVISPLISLMQDQVAALKTAGVPAAYLNRSLTPEQSRAVYRNLLAGRYKILYVAPERLDFEGFSAIVRQLYISFVAVDEAHCISQWGQDFRPSYLRIVHFLESLEKRPVVGAYTATATAQVRRDVERILNLHNPVRRVTGFDRPNLYFQVLHPQSKDEELKRLIAPRNGKSGIVYCATRRKVEYVCRMLQDLGYPATQYHAGLPEEERRNNQEDFLHDRKTIMVATNAFGMGIDKSNVRYVIHYNMPKSLEAYYQEAGRAGRDGTDGACILLYSGADVHMAQYLINNGSENEELDEAQRQRVRHQDLQRLESMIGYCTTSGCLRGYILEYFGQKHLQLCGNCGNCQGKYHDEEMTRQAQMILSCVRRIHSRTGAWADRQQLIDVLRGEPEKTKTDRDLENLPTFGLMKESSAGEVGALLDQLEMQGYLYTDQTTPGVEPTPLASQVLFQGKAVYRKVPGSLPGTRSVRKQLSPKETTLLDALRVLRSDLAREGNIPPHAIFSDATLEDMARKKPKTFLELRKVSGVGELKANWYGASFLEQIRAFHEEGE